MAPVNYVIRVLPEQLPEGATPEEFFREAGFGHNRNMYSPAYLRRVAQAADPDAQVEVVPDLDYGEFPPSDNPLATRLHHGLKLSGSLVQDQSFLVVRRRD